MKKEPGFVILSTTDSRLVRHSSLSAAIAEANRLARAHPGNRFTVYEPRQTHGLADVLVEEHGVEIEPPF